MSSNPDSLFLFRDIDMARNYDENYKDESRGIAAKRNLQRYQWLLEKSLAEINLSAEESSTIWALLRNVENIHELDLLVLKDMVVTEILEIGFAEFGFGDLAQKIQDCTSAQWVAIVDACLRIGDADPDFTNLNEQLIAVGLTKVA